MFETRARIQNEYGIHCRPSTVIIRSVSGYAGTVEVIGTKGRAKLDSILELMALELFPGSAVTIRVSGPDEEAVGRKLAALFESHFDFVSENPTFVKGAAPTA